MLPQVFWGAGLMVYSLSDTTAPFWDRHKLQCDNGGKCYSYTYAEDVDLETWEPGTSCLLNQSMVGAAFTRCVLAVPMIILAVISLWDAACAWKPRHILFVYCYVKIFWIIWLIIWSVRAWGPPHRHNCDDNVFWISYVSLVYFWVELIPYIILTICLPQIRHDDD